MKEDQKILFLFVSKLKLIYSTVHQSVLNVGNNP